MPILRYMKVSQMYANSKLLTDIELYQPATAESYIFAD